MSYNQFTIDSVGAALGVKIKDRIDLFTHIPPVAYSDFLKQALQDYSPVALAIGTEKSRSEFIIAPILFELKRQLKEQISLFSGREFNVDAADGLTGYCDFLISQSPEQLFIQAPVVTVVEAKNDNIKSGFGQCIAEMVAAQRFNQRQENEISAVYGVVTTGSIWQFLQLQNTTVDIDLTEYFLNDVDRILGILKYCITANNLDTAITTVHGYPALPNKPNKEFLLYQGAMVLKPCDKTRKEITSTEGDLSFKWLPKPHISFSCKPDSFSTSQKKSRKEQWEQFFKDFSADFHNIDLEVDSINCKLNAHINSFNSFPLTGQLLSGQIYYSKDSCEVKYVKCALVNLTGRLFSKKFHMNIDTWSILVEPVNDFENYVDDLNKIGGYGITHTINIKSKDEKTFSPTHVQNLLENLFYFFSFMQGLWVSVLLPYGFDKNHNLIWQDLGVRYCDPMFSGHRTPLIQKTSKYKSLTAFEKAFSEYVKLIQKGHKEALNLVINWYIQSNYIQSNVENKLINLLIALESLAWLLLVEEREIYNENFTRERENMNTSDMGSADKKIRRLLEELDIDHRIPRFLPSLLSLTTLENSEYGWRIDENPTRSEPLRDGPGILNRLRNTLVHARKKKRDESLNIFCSTTRIEALNLTVWYLEIVLLKILDFDFTALNPIVFLEHSGYMEEVTENGTQIIKLY